MEDLSWTKVITNFCANCKLTFDNDTQKSIKANILEDPNINSSTTNVHILDALLYIYGLSPEDFAHVFPETNAEAKAYFLDVGMDEVALCNGCLDVFRDIYGSHIKFDNLSHEDSLLKRVIKFKRSETLVVKNELESIEDHNENENKDLFSSWNSNYDGSISDEENIESFNCHTHAKEKYRNDTETGDVKNFNIQDHRPRGRPKKVVSKQTKSQQRIIVKISKRHYQTETKKKLNPIKEDDSAFQPSKRLTRSKVNSSELKKKKSGNYVDELNSSSGSDFEDTLIKKRKTSVKQRIMKKYRKNSVMSNQSGSQHEKIKQEDLSETVNEGEPEDIPDQLNDSVQTNSDSQFIKIRPASGKRLVYTCNVCGKCISRIKLFKVHMNSHKKEANKQKRAKRKKVKCPHCDKLCKNEDSLKVHESNYHSGAQKVCDKCGKTFMRMESLKLHQRFSHTQDKQFECKTCGMKYKWKGSLQSHELTHKNPRPHVCERCGLTFANKSNLNRHKTYHEDEEKDKEMFRCQDCGKVLKNRKSLKKHINGTHREDLQRIFTCNICGKTTKTKPNLRAHMKIHDPNRITKRKSDTSRNVNRTDLETVVVPVSVPQIQVQPLEGDNYQVTTVPVLQTIWY